jgi:hypothetical protein
LRFDLEREIRRKRGDTHSKTAMAASFAEDFDKNV